MMPHRTSSTSYLAHTFPGHHQPKPGLVPRELPDVVAHHESDLPGKSFKAQSFKAQFGPVVPREESPASHTRQEQPCRHATPEQRTFSLAHQPDRRSANGIRRHSETRQQPSADAASSQTPAVPSTQPPVIVVKQISDLGTTSFGFWERRYLTRLRMRIRR